MSLDETGAPAGPLDGNAAAGVLQQIFAFEVTTAIRTCGGCGAVARIGSIRLYGGPMGAVLRCEHCNTAVLRVVHTPEGFWLDLQGARSLRVSPEPAP